MGRLVNLIMAKKQKIVNLLILEKIFEPSQRTYLMDQPLAELEKMFRYKKKEESSNKHS